MYASSAVLMLLHRKRQWLMLCKPMSFCLWPLYFIICILSSSRTNITSRKTFIVQTYLKQNGQRKWKVGGHTFSQVHGLRVMHYPVILRIPAFIRGIYLRQLNTVFPTNVKNVTGSLEKKKKIRLFIIKKNKILSVVIILMRRYQFHRLLFLIDFVEFSYVIGVQWVQ